MTSVAELRDRQEITEVCYRYAISLDSGDWAALATCFTSDAVAHYRSGGPSRGYPAIEARVRSALAPLSASQHLVSNVVVTLAGDTAASVCYLQAQHVRPGTAGGDLYVVAGRYLDRFVRTADGWRIAERRLEISWTEGNPAVLAR
jgi:ketosteroid isomerase-like protein